MTREDWKNHKDFDELSREMNGVFAGRWPVASEMIDGSGGFLTPVQLNADSRKRDRSVAE